MSRSFSSSTSKYKISNPQPLVSPETRSFGQADASPYPSFTPSQPSYSSPLSVEDAPARTKQNGEPSRPTPPGGSPMRPARSRLRDQMSGGPSPPRPSRSDLRPLQMSENRWPSASSSGGFDLPYSPISPIGSQNDLPQENALFSDPFAADKAQRSELRQQTSAAVHQAQSPWQAQGPGGTGSDKLRNAVGAFMTASRSKEQVPVRRPGKSEARQKSKPREANWEVEAGSEGTFGELDNVLRRIKKDWPFVLESDFSASTLALSLLSQAPTSSLPAHPSLTSFLKLHDALSTSLQSAVQSHFQSFAASLPAHATFLGTLSRAQEQVRTSQKALRESRDGFAGKGKAELAGIRARERQVRDMLGILDMVDHLKQVPEQLETLIGDKRFFQATLLLVRSMKTVNKPEIAEIGALSDLKQYFKSQENTLADILVEELQNHIYLKTYNSDSRWQAYTPGQQSLPLMDPLADETAALFHQNGDMTGLSPHVAASHSDGQTNAIAGPGPSSRFSRYLAQLALKPSQDPLLEYHDSDLTAALPGSSVFYRRSGFAMGQASSSVSLVSMALGGAGHSIDGVNPEADSYAYMEMLLEAMAVLGRLGAGLESTAQRVSSEVYALAETTLDEVEERSEQRRGGIDSNNRPQSAPLTAGEDVADGDGLSRRQNSIFLPTETTPTVAALDVVSSPRHAAILRDLFWTLYSKLAAVLEGHRVVYEVARWISSRRDFKDTTASKTNVVLQIPVLEVWKPMQQEVRTMLRSYLFDDAQGSPLDRRSLMSINEVLRDGKIARDRQKQLFKFSETDSRAVNNDIKTIDDSLQQVLRTSVPGLVTMQTIGEGQHSILAGNPASGDDSQNVGQHRKLIPPNAFNVTTLFQPTLAFIERAGSIVPAGFEEETTPFSDAIEDFVVKVFLPQLDERVTASFQNAVSGYDAFQVDRKIASEIGKPPLKSSVRVMALVHSLCMMLETTPFHRENYSRLVVGVIVQYYQQSSARFKDLASLPSTNVNAAEPPLSLPAVWAQREDIISTLTELRTIVPNDRNEISLIGAREIKTEMDLLGNKAIVESQLVNSARKLESLGNLLESLRWFIDSLLDLQKITRDPAPSDALDSQDRGFPAAVTPDIAFEDDRPRLPLTKAMAQRFEAIIQTYEQLAEMVLNTMRLEIRCRVICNLGSSLRKGDFRLESEALEPDPDVTDLGAHLTESDDLSTRTLSNEDREFLFRGLAQLVDHIFIHASRSIKMVNPAGVKKIKRNILSLQQCLRNVSHSPADGLLQRAMSFWDLYERGPKDMLETIRTSKPLFSFEDYNTMLNLQCKADQSEAPSSELNTYLIDLHALSMSIEGWEIGENGE